MKLTSSFVFGGVVGLLVSSLPVVVAAAESPSVDATMEATEAQVQQQPASHWYNGPLTGDPSVTTTPPVPQVSSEKAQSDVSLPAVTTTQTSANTTPSAAASGAVDFAQPQVQLPPVENLTADNQSGGSTNASTSSASQTGTTVAYNTTSSNSSSSQSPTSSASNQSGGYTYATSGSSSLQQQVSRLQQQMANLTAMNMPQQIADLQQQLQQLSGQIAEEQHDLDLLKQQQSAFYKDLDQRIAAVNGSKTTPAATPASSSASNSGTVAAATTSEGGLSDVAEYQKASTLLANKQYDQAQVAYQNYLKDYPQGKFVANAHYWLGELYLVKKDQSQALSEFNTVVKDYSASAKVPDSEYKIALIKMNSGNASEAKKEFQAIQAKFPNSTAAQLASIKLQQLAVSDGG